MLDTFSEHRLSNSRSACSSDHISPIVGPPVKVSQFQRPDSCTNFVAANLIVEECISDVFRNFGHSKNVVLTFDASLGADTIVERVSVIPNQLESAWRKSTLQWIKPDSNYSLKQLRSALALVLIPHRVFAVL